MADLVEHLRSLEEALLDPGVRRDSEAVRNLLDKDFVEFGSSGRTWIRHKMIEWLATESFTPVQVEDFNCALLAPGVALVTYRAVRWDAEIPNRTASLRSSIWIQTGAEWRLRFHQGTPVG